MPTTAARWSPVSEGAILLGLSFYVMPIRTSLVLVGMLVSAAAGFQDQPGVLFFDDFTGPELDRSKWNVIVTGRTVNNEQQAYVDSRDTIDFVSGAAAEGAGNGALAIRPRFRPGFQTPEGRTFD